MKQDNRGHWIVSMSDPEIKGRRSKGNVRSTCPVCREQRHHGRRHVSPSTWRRVGGAASNAGRCSWWKTSTRTGSRAMAANKQKDFHESRCTAVERQLTTLCMQYLKLRCISPETAHKAGVSCMQVTKPDGTHKDYLAFRYIDGNNTVNIQFKACRSHLQGSSFSAAVRIWFLGTSMRRWARTPSSSPREWWTRWRWWSRGATTSSASPMVQRPTWARSTNTRRRIWTASVKSFSLAIPTVLDWNCALRCWNISVRARCKVVTWEVADEETGGMCVTKDANEMLMKRGRGRWHTVCNTLTKYLSVASTRSTGARTCLTAIIATDSQVFRHQSARFRPSDTLSAFTHHLRTRNAWFRQERVHRLYDAAVGVSLRLEGGDILARKVSWRDIMRSSSPSSRARRSTSACLPRTVSAGEEVRERTHLRDFARKEYGRGLDSQGGGTAEHPQRHQLDHFWTRSAGFNCRWFRGRTTRRSTTRSSWRYSSSPTNTICRSSFSCIREDWRQDETHRLRRVWFVGLHQQGRHLLHHGARREERTGLHPMCEGPIPRFGTDRHDRLLSFNRQNGRYVGCREIPVVEGQVRYDPSFRQYRLALYRRSWTRPLLRCFRHRYGFERRWPALLNKEWRIVGQWLCLLNEEWRIKNEES